MTNGYTKLRDGLRGAVAVTITREGNGYRYDVPIKPSDIVALLNERDRLAAELAEVDRLAGEMRTALRLRGDA